MYNTWMLYHDSHETDSRIEFPNQEFLYHYHLRFTFTIGARIWANYSNSRSVPQDSTQIVVLSYAAMYNLIFVWFIVEIGKAIVFASAHKKYPFIKSQSQLTLPCIHHSEGDGGSLVRCGMMATRGAPYEYGFFLQSGTCWICRTADDQELQAEEVQITTNFFLIGMCCCDGLILHAK